MAKLVICSKVLEDISNLPKHVASKVNDVLANFQAKAFAGDHLEKPNAIRDPSGFPAGGVQTTVGSALCDGAPSQVVIATDVDLAATPSIAVALDPAWLRDAFTRDVFLGADGRAHGGFDLGMPVVFQLTARAGADAVEFDVHLTAEGNIVALHDNDTLRTAGVNLQVRQTSLAELRRLDVGSWKGDVEISGLYMAAWRESRGQWLLERELYVTLRD